MKLEGHEPEISGWVRLEGGTGHTEGSRYTNDETRAKLLRKIDLRVWLSLNQLDARNAVSYFDHICVFD
jgi:hypothetical protein